MKNVSSITSSCTLVSAVPFITDNVTLSSQTEASFLDSNIST